MTCIAIEIVTSLLGKCKTERKRDSETAELLCKPIKAIGRKPLILEISITELIKNPEPFM